MKQTTLNSIIAYEEAKKDAAVERKRYYDLLLSRGPHGATDDEVLQFTSIGENAVRRCRLNLMKMEAVESSGLNRPTRTGRQATVWVALPGVDVTQAVPVIHRDELLKVARRKIKEMTEEELEAFVEEDSGGETTSDFLDDGDLFSLRWGGQ
jgi:hypothetical protein